MTDKPLMKCGHTANSTVSIDGGPPRPACAIHAGLTPDAYELAESQQPWAGRMARCCGQPKPSDPQHMAFFEYRGQPNPRICKTCGYYDEAHVKTPLPRDVCTNFVGGWSHEYDSYYCGHNGWD